MNERETENIIQALQHKWNNRIQLVHVFIRLCVTDFFVFNRNKIFSFAVALFTTGFSCFFPF